MSSWKKWKLLKVVLEGGRGGENGGMPLVPPPVGDVAARALAEGIDLAAIRERVLADRAEVR